MVMAPEGGADRATDSVIIESTTEKARESLVDNILKTTLQEDESPQKIRRRIFIH